MEYEKPKTLSQLELENAKLREQLGSIVSRSYRTADKMACLEAENAKLRELCKELAEFLTEAEWLQWPELRAEMRELGVEVTE